MNSIEIKGEFIIELQSKQDWINKIPGALPPKKNSFEQFLFIDKNGHYLSCGADFNAAEQHQTYPVKVYRFITVCDWAKNKS